MLCHHRRLRMLPSSVRSALLLVALACSGSTAAKAQGALSTSTARLVPDSATTTAGVRSLNAQSPASQCHAKYLEARNSGYHSVGCHYGRGSLQTHAQAEAQLGDLSVGNSSTLRLGEGQSSFYSELISDNIYLSGGLGFGRIGVATLVTAADTGTRTVDQFFQGGGNAMLYLAVPLHTWINYAVDTSPTPLRKLDLFFTTALTSDVPRIGGSTTEAAGSLRGGLQLDFTWRSHAEKIGVFFNLRANFVKGTAAFDRNLVGTDTSIATWGLLAGDYSFGVDIAKLVRLGVGGGRSTNQLVRSDLRLTAQMLRQ
jgi:hypothetical protein